MGVWHEPPENWWFLPNDDFMVSLCIGSRVDLISSWGNHFYYFCSFSSLITLPCQHFTYVISHLIRIKTIINISLGLPLCAKMISSDTSLQRDRSSMTSSLISQESGVLPILAFQSKSTDINKPVLYHTWGQSQRCIEMVSIIIKWLAT